MPVAICIRLYGIQYRSADVHRDPRKGLCSAFDGGRGIVGDAIGAVGAGVIDRIVHQIAAEIGRRYGIDGDGRTGQVRLVAGRIHIQQAWHIDAISQ